MQWFLQTVPLFLPGLVMTAIVALVIARPLARAAGIHPAVAALLITGVGLIASATLTPVREAFEDGAVSSGTCDLSRLGWASWFAYVRPTGAALNVILFVPLGIALGLLPPGSRARWAAIIVGLLSPFLVEGAQLVLRSLGRGCEAADVVDNLTGVVLGLGIGVVLRRILSRPTDGTGPA